MLLHQPVVSSVAPPDLLSQQISLLGPVVMDSVPRGAAFGDVVLQPLPAYNPGQSAQAVFR
jgi:neutral ceramidase